ncbi:MAG: hypothetical protein JWN70_3710 [Planctomycetaceae bacterium]|nr:hypothetical protein [Planctomycetaceae bacterium]
MFGKSRFKVSLILGIGSLAFVAWGCGSREQDVLPLPESNQISSVPSVAPAAPTSQLLEDQQRITATASALRELCRELSLPDEIRAVAMIFILPDCPIANSYGAEYSRLNTEYSPRGIPVVVVYVDPDLTAAKMDEHARQYLLKCPVLLDSVLSWGNRAGATKTPEAAVFGLDGSLLYRGRIDDRYVKVGKSRTVTTSHDLRNAFEAILAGKPVANRFTEAVGCHIPGLAHEG